MAYEDFYRSGTYVNEGLGLWLGWICHKDSFCDCLPIWNETKDVCLIFVGEHFADADVVSRLRATGHSIAEGAERASYLVHLYEELGPDFLRELNGPFNGVLIDLRRKDALLFNDRYGLIRLYYHQDEHGLYFASEAKSLLKILPDTRAIEDTSLGEYLSLGCVLQNRTLFKGISLLPPASAWRFAPGSRIKQDTYFDPKSWEVQERLGATEYFEELRDVWTRILPRYFFGERRVGLSMTGGLDSRMILGWAHADPGSLPCYTFGGPYRECADVRLARRATAICHQPHQVLSVGREFLSDFAALAEKDIYVSDGAMDVSGSIDVYVQMLARNIAPIRLSGVNGGEILRGLIAFKPQPLCPQLYSSEMVRHSVVAAETYRRELVGHKLSFIAFKQAPWFMSAKFAVEQSQITFRTPYFDNDLVKLAFRVPSELEGSTAPALRLIAEGNPALETLGTDRGIAFRAIPGLMHVRHQFQQFTFKAEYAYDYGMPQWLAQVDHILSPLHLESLFLGRHKFHHFRTYYRDALAGYVKEILLDPRSRARPYLNGDFLESMVNDHVKGCRNYTTEIHKLLSVELIHRLLLEQEIPEFAKSH
jgi:asparagine synthase (glutamine-hydrolysing)